MTWPDRSENNPGDPYDPRCRRHASDMDELDGSVIPEGEDRYSSIEDRRRAYVRTEEGTYNPHNGHFLCDHCYIDAGKPSQPRRPLGELQGWRCP